MLPGLGIPLAGVPEGVVNLFQLLHTATWSRVDKRAEGGRSILFRIAEGDGFHPGAAALLEAAGRETDERGVGKDPDRRAEGDKDRERDSRPLVDIFPEEVVRAAGNLQGLAIEFEFVADHLPVLSQFPGEVPDRERGDLGGPDGIGFQAFLVDPGQSG